VEAVVLDAWCNAIEDVWMVTPQTLMAHASEIVICNIIVEFDKNHHPAIFNIPAVRSGI